MLLIFIIYNVVLGKGVPFLNLEYLKNNYEHFNWAKVMNTEILKSKIQITKQEKAGLTKSAGEGGLNKFSVVDGAVIA